MFTTELQYAVVRYMFNELGDEAANVGLIAVTEGDDRRCLYRFLQDPSLKSRIDAKVKTDAVDRFAAYVKGQIEKPVGEESTVGIFERLREFGVGLLRTTSVRSVLTNNVEAEFDILFNQWVAPRPRVVRHKAYSPRDPLRSLKIEANRALVRAFRQGYGHPLSRQMFRRRYEIRGTSHKTVFDFAVRQEADNQRREHIFQHVLLLPDPEESFTQAAGLCWRWADIRSANGTDRDLTAVLFERPDQHAEGVAACRRLLRKEEIAIARISDIPAIARKIARSSSQEI
jgi:hypothetical protein